MPLANAAADRRPGNAPNPDPVIQHIAVAIGFGQAGNHPDPRSEPTAWIKPKSKPDVRLDLEPKAKPEADAETVAKAVANSDFESLPDADGRCVTERLAKYGPAGGRPDNHYRHELHAQQVGGCCLLPGRQQHSLLDENAHCRVQRNLLNHRHQSWRRAPHGSRDGHGYGRPDRKRDHLDHSLEGLARNPMVESLQPNLIIKAPCRSKQEPS
jgi:hypothetical protein